MKFKILMMLFLIVSANAKSIQSNYDEFLELDIEQKRSILKSFQNGYKYDLAYSFMAVNWKESMGGKYQINLQDPSCGIYHNNLNSVMQRNKDIKNTNFNRNKICAKLINDPKFAENEALAEFTFWKGYHHNNWRKIFASYNGGFKGNKAYAADIINKIKAFKRILKNYNYIITNGIVTQQN